MVLEAISENYILDIIRLPFLATFWEYFHIHEKENVASLQL